jgi:hypothetical protein
MGEAAERLGIGRTTLQDHYRSGTWPFREIVMKVGGRLKVSRYQLERFARGELAPPSDEAAS